MVPKAIRTQNKKAPTGMHICRSKLITIVANTNMHRPGCLRGPSSAAHLSLPFMPNEVCMIPVASHIPTREESYFYSSDTRSLIQTKFCFSYHLVGFVVARPIWIYRFLAITNYLGNKKS